MNTNHLSDNDIQQYALKADPAFSAHIDSCAECSLKVANYKALFTALNTAEKPAFNFDLEVLVMKKLPKPKVKLPLLPISLAIAAMMIPILVYGEYLLAIIKNTHLIPVATFAIIAVGVLFFQMRELFVSYRKKMQNLLQQ